MILRGSSKVSSDLVNIRLDIKKMYNKYNSTVLKCANGMNSEFRQSFAKETFSYDEHLKSYNIQY